MEDDSEVLGKAMCKDTERERVYVLRTSSSEIQTFADRGLAPRPPALVLNKAHLIKKAECKA